jgi:hypothetical protein
MPFLNLPFLFGFNGEDSVPDEGEINPLSLMKKVERKEPPKPLQPPLQGQMIDGI